MIWWIASLSQSRSLLFARPGFRDKDERGSEREKENQAAKHVRKKD